MHVKPHFEPSQVAALAWSGVRQGTQDAPHALTSKLLGQSLPQPWVPSGQVAAQVAPVSTHAPWQAFLSVGQVMSQAPAVQAAAPPPFGVAHGLHDTPQVSGLVSSKQPPGHMCWFAGHVESTVASPATSMGAETSVGASAWDPPSSFPSAEPSCCTKSCPLLHDASERRATTIERRLKTCLLEKWP
jgi:hypothetical protein